MRRIGQTDEGRWLCELTDVEAATLNALGETTEMLSAIPEWIWAKDTAEQLQRQIRALYSALNDLERALEELSDVDTGGSDE